MICHPGSDHRKTPSSVFVTGRYPLRTGMLTNGTGDLIKPANEIMIPKVLKPAGYVTAQVGKWNQLPLERGDWGFDEYLRFPGSGRYWDTPYTVNGQTKQLAQDKYLPDVMHEFLIDFITRHKSQPCFRSFAFSCSLCKFGPSEAQLCCATVSFWGSVHTPNTIGCWNNCAVQDRGARSTAP